MKKQISFVTSLSSFLLVAHCIASPIEFVGTIVEDATIQVPSDFPSIQDSLAYLSDKSIAAGIYVTIQVADGAYSSSCIEIDHPFGSQLYIIGNTNNPAACSISFTTSQDGFRIQNSHSLGKLNGFKLIGSGATNGMCGIRVTEGSKMSCGPSLVIESFNYGVFSDSGSSVSADGVIAQYCRRGFVANRSEMSAVSSISQHNTEDGYFANAGGEMWLTGATAGSNGGHGFTALCNSTIYASNSLSQSNARAGYRAVNRGMVDATYGMSTGNQYGVWASYGGYISVSQGKFHGTYTNAHPAANVYGLSYGSFIAAY